MKRFVTLEKAIGQTPLECAENWRKAHEEYEDVPLAYAGRLDPMASGALLILIGDECKRQTEYHGLDKAYEFSVLFGIASDTGDVLGRLKTSQTVPFVSRDSLKKIAANLVGPVTFPYPNFSSKTVQGKPLHMWTLEGRLDEIEIPTITSTIYHLALTSLYTIERTEAARAARKKIDTIPPVIDPRKALGNDFRRTDVRADWDMVRQDGNLPAEYNVATFTCIASSGTYMRSLAAAIANELGTCGLAWHIHRSQIGTYSAADKQWINRYVQT
jgi:tRNA pseudouridine55 synthase